MIDPDHAKRVLEHQEKQRKRVLDPMQNHGDAVVIIQQLHDRIDELQEAIQSEREACAKVAEGSDLVSMRSDIPSLRKAIADAIRARTP